MSVLLTVCLPVSCVWRKFSLSPYVKIFCWCRPRKIVLFWCGLRGIHYFTLLAVMSSNPGPLLQWLKCHISKSASYPTEVLSEIKPCVWKVDLLFLQEGREGWEAARVCFQGATGPQGRLLQVRHLRKPFGNIAIVIALLSIIHHLLLKEMLCYNLLVVFFGFKKAAKEIQRVFKMSSLYQNVLFICNPTLHCMLQALIHGQ